jgi:hypothetical protein
MIRVFSHELGILLEWLDRRVDHLAALQKGRGPAWDFAFTRFADRSIDVEANLAVKSFFFVAKQSLDKRFHLLFLLQDFLGAPPGVQIPDGSRPKNLKKVLVGLIERTYLLEEDILEAVKDYGHIPLVIRLCRNSLKQSGTFDVQLQNGVPSFKVPMLGSSRTDSSLQYLRIAVPEGGPRALTMDRPFLDDAHRFVTNFGKMIETKWRRIQAVADEEE